MLTTLLLGAALAAEPAEPVADASPPARSSFKEPGVRIFLGLGTATSSGGTSEAGELGFHWLRQGDRIGAEYGLSLSAYRIGDVTLPVFNFDGGVRWRPNPSWRVQPVVSGGVGVSFLLVLPVPSVHLALGATVRLGQELRLDATLRARQLLDLYADTDGVTVATLEVGVGF